MTELDHGSYIIQIELSDDSGSNRITIIDFYVDINYYSEENSLGKHGELTNKEEIAEFDLLYDEL